MMRGRGGVRGRGHGAWLMWWLGMLAAGTGCSRRDTGTAGAQLRMTTSELTPGTGFELVLERPVASFAEVGTTSAVPPLRVEPAVPGDFVWRSRRSGVFRPGAALPLGTTLEFRLRDGLRDAEGRPVAGGVVRRVETPGLEVVVEAAAGWAPHVMPSEPVMLVKGNAALDADSFQGRVYFTDGVRRVAASTSPAWTNDVPWHRTWQDRFDEALEETRQRPGERRDETRSRREEGAVVRCAPASPLVSTGEWRFVVGPGVRSRRGAATRLGAETVLGYSRPFGVEGVDATATLARGREMGIRLTRRVDRASVTNVGGWLSVEPAVEGLEADVMTMGDGRGVRVRGRFGLGTNYVVRVGRGLRAEDGPLMGEETRWTNGFAPLMANAWLPVFDAVQTARGGRGLGVMTVNVPEARVRVKSLSRQGLIPALRAYERYRRGTNPWEADTVGGAALDYAGLAGRTVKDEVLDLHPVTTDEARRTELGWDRLAGEGRAGAFFVELDLHGLGDGAQGTRVGPQALVQLTDLGHVLKRGKDDAVAWVFRHRDARPVEGARVSLRTDEDEELASGLTDASGLVRMASPTNAAWVLVEHGEDLHASRVGEGELNLWNQRLPGREPTASGLRLLGFVDRSHVRPGEVLHVKWAGRRWGPGGWEMPGTNGVAVEVKGPRGDVLTSTNVALGENGTCTMEWVVPAALRGGVSVEARLADATWEQTVVVREFQPPSFEVRADLTAGTGPGTAVQGTVSGWSLQGRPLTRGRVRWFLRGTDMSMPPGAWEGFSFVGPSRMSGEDEGSAEDVHEQGTGVLGTNGPVMLEARLPMNVREPRPQACTLELDVTDLDQKTVETSREVVRHSSDFYLGFRWRGGAEFVPEAGKPLPVEVVAMDREGKPWAGAVTVKARLLRTERAVVQVERAGRSVGYEGHVRHVEVGTVTGTVTPATAEGTGWGATTELALPAPPAPGRYWIELASVDGEGRPVLTQGTFHVSGDARLAWHWKAGQSMEMVPLRQGVASAGTNWPMLVKAPFGGTALVTVEREGVARAYVTALRGNAPLLDVMMEAGDAPNVNVGVLLVRGIEGNPHEHPMPEWRFGYGPVLMPPRERRLQVGVTAARAVLRPREEAVVTVGVKDAGGRGVAGAEVTLYAVDEAVLMVAGTEPPDLAAALEEPVALGVRTTVSLARLMPEDPALRTFANKGHAGGGGGREVMLRRNFEPAPYWNAGLRTDGQGEVEARFAVPDGLTRYRLVAVALHGAGSAGTGVGSLVVQKPLMIEPSLPRAAHVGDRLMARAVVINATSNRVEARVTVRPGTHAVPTHPGALEQVVLVPAGGSAPVDVEVSCVGEGDDPWVWKVEGGGEADASEARMPVMEPLPEVRDSRWLVAGAGRHALMDGMDPAATEAGTTLTLRVGNGPWALMGEGIRHLLHYPYGCAEQTGSALIPWLALGDRPELMRVDGVEATRAIAAGMERLWSMQTGSGGLGYWPGGTRPQRWASAYGAWVMAVALKRGFPVDGARLARLHAWLDEQWRKDGPEPGPEVLHERCLTALALAEAGKGDAGLNEAMALAVERLTREDRCLLALAWMASGGPAEDAAKWLAMPRRQGEGFGRFGNEGRGLALEMLAMERCGRPSAEVSGKLVRLMEQRARGHWGTTQGNAWAVWALSEHARNRAQDDEVVGQLQVGARMFPVRLGRGNPVELLSIPVTAAELAGGVQWSQEGGAKAWMEAGLSGRMKAVPGLMASMAAVDRGFAVRRRYERLDEENRPGPADALQVGDRVLVTLEIDAAEDASWVAVDEPVPAVLEPSLDRWRGEEDRWDGGDAWVAGFAEVRGGRRRVFIDSLPEGRHRVRYVARVRAAGTAVAGPARVEAMYEPGRNGLSAPSALTAR